MKRDFCLPVGPPPTPEQLVEIEEARAIPFMGYQIHNTQEGYVFRKPGGIAREAKSVGLAMAAIAKLEGKQAKGSGAVCDDGPNTYRIGRDRASLEASRKIVEAREGTDAK